ncbi:RNA polymerase sigma-I factor [Virgibacillus sp. MSJ-26]|uniref:RNA polymerase sigma-I factor n=1 Tax=Virgibacillus sp. MSJ-26 TaxID=2841522 RepID=UPI00353044BE
MTQESTKDLTLEEMVIVAQQGDLDILNHLLKAYQPFIAKCVSGVCKRYIDPEQDDEFSIGLSAFHSAIETFSPDKGSSFLSFAKLVITRRIIDDIRAKQRYPDSVSLDETFDAEKMENPREIKAVKDAYKEEQDIWYRRQEILDFQKKLAAYKISLSELTEVAPKHKDARESAIRTARILFNDADMKQYVHKKKRLPMKDLVKKVDVSKKTLERNRKYILAIFIVLDKEYLYLNDYLKGVGQ